MTYIIKIEDEDQLNFLKRVVENLYIKMHSNTSGYVEYLDTIDALKINFDNASIEKDEIIEIISNPTNRELASEKKESTTKSVQTRKKSVKKDSNKTLSPEIRALPTFCDEHTKYGAQRAPRTDCEACWNAYKRLNPTRYAMAHRKFLRTHGTDNS